MVATVFQQAYSIRPPNDGALEIYFLFFAECGHLHLCVQNYTRARGWMPIHGFVFKRVSQLISKIGFLSSSGTTLFHANFDFKI